ncbi:MAG: sulfite exporter TauE/SafE family protein [Chloroflexi bacterium]|nr:sulfite exporter TauE/SafE family protein [Chloroflexota bacterium]
MDLELASVALIIITLVAATVNGALGYGFSSLTVPVALLFYTNKVLNPALVVIEVAVNAYVLYINRAGLSAVWRRVIPIIIGLIPGIVLGSLALSYINPGLVKVVTYTILLPLILLQASGFRRYVHAERAVGVPFGSGIGLLYSLTTISGPPLALLFNNQGLVRQEFRAGLALVRVVESTGTAAAYYFLGLYSLEVARMLPLIVPSVLIGIPVGAFLIRRIEAETFRRVCMSFDAWVVGFGLSRTLIEVGFLTSPNAYVVLGSAVVIDAILLYQFFSKRIQISAIRENESTSELAAV